MLRYIILLFLSLQKVYSSIFSYSSKASDFISKKFSLYATPALFTKWSNGSMFAMTFSVSSQSRRLHWIGLIREGNCSTRVFKLSASFDKAYTVAPCLAKVMTTSRPIPVHKVDKLYIRTMFQQILFFCVQIMCQPLPAPVTNIFLSLKE